MDIPTGGHTKVEDIDTARKYARDFMSIGEKIGIKVECAITYGGQPVGRNIGPALEVIEALEVLEGNPPSSSTLEKSTSLAGIILEMAGLPGDGKKAAEKIIKSGEALDKFKEIVRAQGCDLEKIESDAVRKGNYSAMIISPHEGYVSSIHNRNIVKIARACGCPHDKYGGIELNMKLGHQVEKGDTLFTIYSDNKERLKQAEMLAKKINPFNLEGMVLERVPGEKIIHNL
jgi:AMP phosphorylase